MRGRHWNLLLVGLFVFVACNKDSGSTDAGRRAKRAKRDAGTTTVADMPRPSTESRTQLKIALDPGADLAARRAALAELKRLRDPNVIFPLITAVQQESGLQAEFQATITGLNAGEYLADQIDNGDLAAKQRATLAAYFVKDEVLVEALIDALADQDVVVRTQTASALRAAGDPRAVEPLIKVLGQDPEPDVRTAAAQALATLGGPAAEAALAQAEANEKDEFVKGVIKQARQPR